MIAAPLSAQAPQVELLSFRESTHDWTSTPGSSDLLNEAWADVKAPGDGRTYAVGTIDVDRVDPTSTFSNVLVTPPPAPATGFAGANPPRQVAIIQITNAAGAILNQTYFYGFTLNELRATNARGISVWPVLNPDGTPNLAATRVAICGETFDAQIPGSGQGGNPLASAIRPSGFVTVYDGALNLQWSHQFFGSAVGDCAITDVSIRREGSVDPVDVVTYCGISTHGRPGPGTPLTPLRPFSAPAGTGSPNPASGSTDNSVGGTGPQVQWDGIVGRLLRDTQQGTVPVFHSIVGGREQDGLFGIAEIDADRFAVVGSTASPPNAGGLFTFPFTGTAFPIPMDLSVMANYCAGTTLVFDAAPTRLVPAGALRLEMASPIGTMDVPGDGVQTVARDVLIARDAFVFQQTLVDAIYVVGSTNDPGLLLSTVLLQTGGVLDTTPFQATLGGMTDGFVVLALDTPTPVGNNPLIYGAGSFHGDALDDGLTGIGAWNEFHDHATVVGFSDQAGDTQMDVVSIFADTAAVPGSLSALVDVRRATFGGSGAERPATMGALNATMLLPPFPQPFLRFGLGSPAGGGVGVDSRARAQVVGATPSSNYPVSPTPFLVGRGPRAGLDAVRAAIDMLPGGVGRSDGTGSTLAIVPPPPPPGTPFAPTAAPTGTMTGGTTPSACLRPFGDQIGSLGPVGFVRRMLVDYEGASPTPAGTNLNLLIDRPPASSTAVSAFVQFGFASQPGALDPNGLEIWLNSAPVVLATVIPGGIPGSQRFAVALPASPSITAFAFQMVCLLGTNTCTGSPFVASPAISISY